MFSPRETMAIQSNPTGIFCWFLRNASRSQRLIRFRATALRATPFRTEQPNRLTRSRLGNTLRSRNSPRKLFPSLRRRLRSGPESRRERPNLSRPAGNYGMSRRRPFFRRRCSTRRPAFLDMRSRNPCRRFRLMLDLSVRFFFTRALYQRGRMLVKQTAPCYTPSSLSS